MIHLEKNGVAILGKRTKFTGAKLAFQIFRDGDMTMFMYSPRAYACPYSVLNERMDTPESFVDILQEEASFCRQKVVFPVLDAFLNTLHLG